MKIFPLPACTLLLVISLISGCGGGLSNSRLIDYRNTRTVPSLELPPDLATAPDGTRSAASKTGEATTYSGYAGRREAGGSTVGPVLPEYPNVKLVREGQTRFVVVKADPTVVWSEVREFLTQTGLSIAHENAKAGLIETDWAENHALVGATSDSRLAKYIASFYSSSLRDKYRVRLERGSAPGTTEVYLTHSGMEEVALDPNSYTRGGEPAWRPRPSDPELEAEMLHRLVAFLGGGRSDESTTAGSSSGASANAAPEVRVPTPGARLTRNGSGATLLTLEDSLERAWRRVGLSLDRIGFTVEDRDRSKGIYYVRYIDPDAQTEKKGFFARLFSDDDKSVPSNQYQVHVRSADDGTDVEVLDKQGDVETSKTGDRILSLLYEQLK